MKITSRTVRPWLVALSTLVSLESISLYASPSPADRAGLFPLGGDRPLAFEENRGQTDPRVRYLARGNGSTLFLTPAEAVLALRGSTLRIRWTGGAADPRMTAESPLPGVTNYLTGKDPSRWRTGVPSWTRVHYDEVWPGIDLVFYGNPKQLEHDVIVAPGADPGQVRLAFAGAEELRIDPAGDLVARVGGEEVRLRRPVSSQEVNGARRGIESSWRLLSAKDGAREAGFRVGAYDRTRPLVIDPVLVYSTYLGGSRDDWATAIAVDAASNAYLTGYTVSPDFPLVAPFDGTLARFDAFVTRFDAEGQPVFSTFLGGSDNDTGEGIAVAPDGRIVVVGGTDSTDFPRVEPLQPPIADQDFEDAFVAVLDPSGASLLFASHLGGTGVDHATAVAADPAGAFYVTGYTNSSDFPTVDPLFATVRNYDVFITKITGDPPALVWSTFYGGSDAELPSGIAVDPAGHVYVAGSTQSHDLPTAHAFQPVLAGLNDPFVVKFAPSGKALIYATYFGGTGADFGASGVAADAAGNAYLAGQTSSADFPTRNALQPKLASDRVDAWVAKLDPAGVPIYSTFLGGTYLDGAAAIAADPAGRAWVTGYTQSFDFPLADPIRRECRPVISAQICFGDAFVSVLGQQGDLVFSTYLGGDTAYEYPSDIAVDPRGDGYVFGSTASWDFPQVGAFQPQPAGGFELFVTRISAPGGPPICSAATVRPSLLWPPNGRMVPVAISGITDPDGDPVTISVTGIHQDEPLSKKGQPDATGIGTSSPQLRADRAGSGDGRVYHITFTATDPQEASCTGTVTVCVPHDQGKQTCGDGGALVDSSGGR